MRHYAVIDVETTGSLPGGERITEIAIFRYDGTTVVDKFESLVDPEVSIPPFISNLTGITNDMVSDQPLFRDIADSIEEITQGAVFVAHNVGFDYGMVRGEFDRLGIDFSRNRLCTVQLSRSILPGYPSYSLGKLTKSLGIPLQNRHRAAGDALATVELFSILLQTDATYIDEAMYEGLAMKGLNPALDRSILNELPEAPGLFYFHSEEGELLYQGNSDSISRRVFALLRNPRSQKMQDLKSFTTDITYELTGSALIAKLRAAEVLAKDKPPYNKGMPRPFLKYGIIADYNHEGYLVLQASKVNKNDQVQHRFDSPDTANKALKEAMKKHNLCAQLKKNPGEKIGKCANHPGGQCLGACNQVLPAEDYNARVLEAIEEVKERHRNFIVIDKGRHGDERSVVLVEDGRYCKYAFADLDVLSSTEAIKNITTKKSSYPFGVTHIRKYLENHRVEKVVFL